MASSTPRIEGYDYPPPTKGDVMESLQRVLGAAEAEAAWNHACHVAGVDATAEKPSLALLTSVSRALIQMGGLRSVVGNSVYVRILTFSTLSERLASAAKGSGHV